MRLPDLIYIKGLADLVGIMGLKYTIRNLNGEEDRPHRRHSRNSNSNAKNIL
jgi:hypothetical protein